MSTSQEPTPQEQLLLDEHERRIRHHIDGLFDDKPFIPCHAFDTEEDPHAR